MAHRAPKAFPYTLIPHNARDTTVAADHREAYARRFSALGDPLADAVVEMARRRPAGEGRAMFEQALAQGIDTIGDPPPELTAFFRGVEAPPYWADADQLDLAARVIGRTGPLGLAALSMGALLGGYLAHRVTKPLVITGDLDRMAARRIAETTEWFVQVTRPGALKPFAAGWTATLRVRLMHALVRAGMSRRPDWDWEAWDHPVNQSQMAGTNALFAVAILSGSEALGARFTAREKAAVYHYWRVVGHLMGVDPEILLTDERDAARLMSVQAVYEFDAPDLDSQRLARALLQAIGPLTVGDDDDLPHRVGRATATAILCAYARQILGSENADFLALPDHALMQRILGGAATIIRSAEVLRCVLPGATRLSETCGRRSWVAAAQRMMRQHNGDSRYRRHDHLAGQPAPTTSVRHSAIERAQRTTPVPQSLPRTATSARPSS
ncbi:oxygenase MpaB family protein [Nocardia abscessus]|uniref:oxygenase MpaB family protein n=1 Tax=Nocardia abscessus TaxID=120957 RepID=UPI002453AFA8|nr:oxygenase MpaB family protein [Nocardia abscessus]